jgi:AcrR family transcriptional regulator
MGTNTSVTRQEGGAAADVSLRQPPTESSQERILSAATQLFLNQGYEKTSIDEIGVAAGLSGPAIYYHFRSKSDLLLRVVDRAQESALRVTASLLDPALDPLDALSLVVAAWVDDSFRNRALILTYTHEHPHLDQEIRGKLGAKYRAITDMWMLLFARLRPQLPEAERLAMVDSAFWLIRSQAFYRSALPAEQLSRRLRMMVLGSLLADDDPADRAPALLSARAGPSPRAVPKKRS